MARDLARRVLETEARAILDLVPRLDAGFDRAVGMLHGCKGRVVVTGMGKSGLIGAKIAATLASTGTPALFLHPAEAVHGDIGMVVAGDVVLGISHSGETEELVRLIEILKRLDVPLVALTGNPASALGRYAAAVLDVRIEKEASPIGLVPTASTTAALAMGDALAMAVLERRGFTLQDFARLHPGGRIGRQVVTVEALMHKGGALPAVPAAAPMREAIAVMTAKRLGMTCVVNPDGTLAGVITDGDLRRRLEKGDDLLALQARQAMSATPVTIARDELAAAALHVMETRKITALVVVDDRRVVEGVLHLHDLWRTQLF
jgi:arabinose-5-phosphate isomerase